VDYVDYGLESSGYVNYELEFRRLCGLETSGLCDLWTRILWNM